MSANQSSYAGIWRRARSQFLLEDVEQQVRSRRPEQQDIVARFHRAAVRRTSVADGAFRLAQHRLGDAYRDAARLFIVAAVAAHDVAADPRAVLADSHSPWEALASLSGRAAIADLPSEVEAARKILDSEYEPLAFDRARPEQLPGPAKNHTGRAGLAARGTGRPAHGERDPRRAPGARLAAFGNCGRGGGAQRLEARGGAPITSR